MKATRPCQLRAWHQRQQQPSVWQGLQGLQMRRGWQPNRPQLLRRPTGLMQQTVRSVAAALWACRWNSSNGTSMHAVIRQRKAAVPSQLQRG